MINKKPNPKRWYMVMVLCVCFSVLLFVAAPRMGYAAEDAHTFALMMAIWAPTLGILGVRAEFLQRKQ